MAEPQVLAGEPGYLVRDLVQEVIGRRQQTIQEMRGALRRLATDLVRTIMAIKDEKSWIDLDRANVEKVEWADADGSLIVTLDLPGMLFVAGKTDPDKVPQRYHVDEFVAEVFAGTLEAAPLTYEIAQFIAGLVDQFSAMKKHTQNLDLGRVTFENTRWIGDDRLAFSIRHGGLPLLPQQVRWA